MSVNINKFTKPAKIEQAIKQINNLNARDSLPFMSPIISGESNSPSVICIPKSGSIGRWCGSGYLDYFPELSCKDLEGGEEEEGEGEEDEEQKKKKEEELQNRTKTIEIFQNRFRWGYTA